LTARLAERIHRDFEDPGSASEVCRIVSTASESERVQAAIVFWARGSIDRLRDGAALARIDWRDVLVRGELADDDWRSRLDDELGPIDTD
jgi:hypothetical protein